jgi:CheY-like chemotaxis protein
MPRPTGQDDAPELAPSAIGAPTRTLLVVDDSEDAQELFRIHLQRSGFEVLSAHNGQDALALLNGGAHLPSLIIVDLLMPVMDGMELIESLRADERLADLPVLVVSAVDVPKGARLPHTRYIRKPFRNADLLSNIEDLVGAPVGPDP